MMLDYKAAQEEEERYRILTIKTNKVPETKKVKSNAENIFANSQPLNLGGTDLTKKKGVKKVEKTEEEILVPELVLTVRPLRKG